MIEMDQIKEKEIETKLSTLEAQLVSLKSKRDTAEEQERFAEAYEATLGKLSPSRLSDQIRRLQKHITELQTISDKFKNSTREQADIDQFIAAYDFEKESLLKEDLLEIGPGEVTPITQDEGKLLRFSVAQGGSFL
jgi:Ca2+-binding EF-hand superfamily protein